MKRYWWIDAEGVERGPVAIEGLVALRSERSIDSTTLVREGDGEPVPFHELDLQAEIQRAGRRKLALLVRVGGAALVAFAALFVAIYAPNPVGATSLGIFVVLVAALAFVVGRHRQVGLSFTATLIPAAIGMMAMIQQPVLLDPLAPLACEEGERLVADRAKVVATHRWADTTLAAETAFWTACVGPEDGRVNYAPMFLQGLGLFLVLGAANLLGRFAFPLADPRLTRPTAA